MLDSVKPFRNRSGAFEEFHHSSEYHQTLTNTSTGPLIENGLTDEDTWTVHPTSRITRTYSLGGDQYEERDSSHLYEELRRQQALSPPPAPSPVVPVQQVHEYHQTNLNVHLAPTARERSEVSMYVEDMTPKRFAPVKMTLSLPKSEPAVQSEVNESVRVNRKVNIKRTWKVLQTHEVAQDEKPLALPNAMIDTPLSLHQFKITLPEKDTVENNIVEVKNSDAFNPVEITVALPEKTSFDGGVSHKEQQLSDRTSAFTSLRDTVKDDVKVTGGEQTSKTSKTSTTTTRRVTTTKAENRVHRQEMSNMLNHSSVVSSEQFQNNGGSQNLKSSFHSTTVHDDGDLL